MARKEDTVVTRVQIDGKQAINQLGKLEMEANEYRQALKNIKKNTDEWTQTNNKLTETKSKISAVRKELGLAGMTSQQLSRYQRELRNEINNTTTRGTARYRELRAELLRVNSAINTQRAELRNTASFWDGFKNQLKSFALLAAGTLGVQAIVGKFQNLITGSAELADAMSDVQKTTGRTKEEVESMMATFKTFNTRTPRMELLGMAEVAGRLGIKGKKDIEGFVKAADQINVALGDVLGDTETVMKDMGKLTDTFGLQQVYGIEQSMLKVGSAINELGMASTANERNIVDFTRRLAGVAPIAGISIQNILGMGATLDALGQTVEVSGTAISRLFIEMASNASKFAKYAKMDVQDFVKLMNEDANEAFIRVLEGVKGNSEGITELAATLGDLGLDGARVVGVFANLANNSEKLRQQQKLSNEAFKEGTSVTNEFALKNENLAAKLSKVQKWFHALWMSSTLRNGIESTINLLTRVIEVPISSTLEDQRVKMNALVSMTMQYNIGSAERLKYLKKINSEYPELLKNMDMETVTNEQLRDTLKEVNEELINKIIIQKQDEEAYKIAEKAASKQIEAMNTQIEVQSKLLRVAKTYNMEEQLLGKTLEEQAAILDDRQKRVGYNRTAVETLTYQVQRLRNIEEEAGEAALKSAKKQEEAAEIRKQLKGGLLEEPNPTGGDDDTTPVVPVMDDSTKKKLEDLLQNWREFRAEITKVEEDYQFQMLEKDEQELERIRQKFTALQDQEKAHKAEIETIRQLTETEQSEHLSRLARIEQQKQTQLASKREEFAKRDEQKRKDAQERLRIAKLNDDQKEVEQVIQHYQELIDLAIEYGWDTTELAEMREMALDAIRQKWRDKEEKDESQRRQEELQAEIAHANAKSQVLQAYSQVFGATIDLIGKKSGEMNAAQKVLALFQIAADTAMSIMKAQVVALQAAAAAGPAGPAVYVATKLSILASVLSAAARAKSILGAGGGGSTGGSDGTPTSPGVNPSIGDRETGGRGFYYGGHTGGDMYGRFAGFVHQNEYVVPEYLMRDPYVADLTGVIEAERRKNNFQSGGSTNTTEPRSSSSSDRYMTKEEGKSIVDALVAELLIMRNTPLKSYTVLDEYQAKKTLLDNIRKDANL